ncbi:MAG TPA: dTDP-4-dehydrorhamnose reductase [Anaerolineaceae bacterium]|jgi:dTDP-4-dehydrorhamnose reductase|nr:dTDP-4-dehydrorhamnose reductase [Anaerolineaceae bacterium]
MKKILQIGTIGQLGWELLRTCAPLGEVVALDYPDVDLSDSDGLRELVRSIKPDIIINAAAYTNVDKAESEQEKARAINAIGPGVLAEEAKKIDATLIHYSTDYVFDGTKFSPYVETDQPNPINIYGQTKLEGEQLIAVSGCAYLILRSTWIYSKRSGFVAKVLEWARTQDIIRIVDDQISSPTPARLMAEITASLVSKIETQPDSWVKELSGIYHCACNGYCSRYDWAKEVLRLDSNSGRVLGQQLFPASTTEFSTPAQRPLRSCLDSSKFEDTFQMKIPHWLNALELAMEE